MCIRDRTCVRKRVFRVRGDRTVKTDEGFCESFFGKSVEVIAAAEIVLERLRNFGAALCKLLKLAARQLRKQDLDHFIRKSVFERQNIRQSLIDRGRPDRGV